MPLPLQGLSQLRRGGTRFVEIASILIRHGFAERLDRVEPEFVKRWLHHEDVARLAELSEGERARLACEELGPTFVKVGQILSTRPDIVSPEVTEELAKLQTRTPAESFDEIRGVIEESLGRPLEELFAQFDREPLASASIGQVHAARLASGERVVVKVRHPGIQARVRTDFDVITTIAEFLDEHDDRLRAFQLGLLAEQVRRTLMDEMDFRTERRHLERFRRAFEGDPTVVLPRTYAELCSDRVLTMERVSGRSIADREWLEAQGFDRARLARDGARVFLEMVFRDGVFHADPHPGNVLVSPEGRIVLIDFGMVAYIGDDLREPLVQLLVALVGGDHRRLQQAVEDVADVPGSADRVRLRRDLAEFQAKTSGIPIDELEATQTLVEFTGLLRRHRILLPPAVSMLVKVLMMLDGTARSLDRRVSILELVRPYCEEMIGGQRGLRQAARRAGEASRDWARLAQRLPRVLDDVGRRVERGQLSVDLVHSGLETTVNRLVSGVLCAAMLLGGAILWALRAPPVILGVPVVGVLASTLALLHGIRLLTQLRGRG